MGETCPAMPAEETLSLDTGGIAIEHFENARKRAAAIVAKMTLAEKVSQFGTRVPAIPRIGLPAFNYYASDSEALHGLIHSGPITSFPLPLAMGCSWNRSLMYRVFAAVSDEIWACHKRDGLGLAMFSPPTVNMGARDPRWGRIAENYSEDPFLVGQMAIYTIHGMQGNDRRYLKTIACAKHFIANDTENDRHVTSATVDPRSFWEYYTRGFEACVKGGHVFTVMSSYNEMNGIPTTASRFLLTDLLRKRWGFQGYVVSDCGAVSDICLTHHFVRTLAEASALAINAGCDISCGWPLGNQTFPENLAQAMDEMLIGEPVLDQSLIRSITGRVLLGEFDPPDQIPYRRIPISCLDSAAHRELALDAARQSIVLLKNQNGALPLDKSRLKKIAVIGPMAATCYLGNYSGAPQFRVSPLQGIKESLRIPSGPSYEKRASDFTQSSGGLRLKPYREGGEALSFIDSGSWAAYQKVMFSGATEFHGRIASAADGTMEVRLDSLNGPLVAKLEVSRTGSEQKPTSVSASLKPVMGVHTVFLRFFGGPLNLFNSFDIESFNLTPESPVPARSRGGTEVTYALGCTVVGKKDPTQFAEAVKAAKETDVALVFVGADQRVDTETQDRYYIHLPGVQHELVQAVYTANPRTILVISSNCPVAVNWEEDHLPAIVGGLFLGEQQGKALADVLFGDYNPGGKVSTTWYGGVEDLPDFHDYNIRRGRTYMYFKGKPLYAFGHGLSYTTFEYKNLRVSESALGRHGRVTITFDVANTGHRAGDEIVQLYVRCAGRSVERPIKQLVNFDRLHLKAGEMRTMTFELSHEEPALRYWDECRYEFVVEPGTLEVMVGASSVDIRLRQELLLRR